jgi:aryl-alcohol dehydrogenase-like predicted oxidoreductase
MEPRRLGQSSLEVPSIAFGCNVFGWTVDEKTSFALLDAWLDAGFNFLDTADVYSRWHPGNSGGESETIIGNWMKARGNRDKVIVATKLGIEMGPGKKGLSRTYMQQAVEASLRRLQTDYIDLYQSHRDDPETPIEETLSAYAELIKQGKVREIGASNYAADRLAESLRISTEKGLPRYQSLQPLYNLYDRAEYESDLAPVCEQRQLGVIPYFSLASGFLTGKYRSSKDIEGKARAGIVGRYMTARGEAILRALDEVAAASHSTPAAVALAWLIARPAVTAPIASATSTAQLKSLIQGAQLKLDADCIAVLDRASA